jgi:hypothetical protein
VNFIPSSVQSNIPFNVSISLSSFFTSKKLKLVLKSPQNELLLNCNDELSYCSSNISTSGIYELFCYLDSFQITIPTSKFIIYGFFNSFFNFKDFHPVQFVPSNIYRKLKNGGFILGKGFLLLSNPFVKFISKSTFFSELNSWEMNVTSTVINDEKIQYFFENEIPSNISSISVLISFNSGFSFHEIGTNMAVKGKNSKLSLNRNPDSRFH